MNFLIKGVLKKIINQYLNVQDQINLEKGHLHLASGHLNHVSINSIPVLSKLGVKVLYSEYVDLTISLPILEILSKPINIKVERLQIVLSVDGTNENAPSDIPQQILETSEDPNI